MTKSKIIEKSSDSGAYDILCDSVIVDHPKHGRILITEGYGGDSLNGYTYRWRHGTAVKLKPDDTFDTLKKEIEDMESAIECVVYVMDIRDDLAWDGKHIAKLAESLGL